MIRKPSLLLIVTLSACAARSASTQPPPTPGTAAATDDVAPKSLERSHFSRAPQGTLGEAELQTILESPLELDLPSRVGVLPIIAADDWRGPSPSYAMASPASFEFSKLLSASDSFTHVTEMMPIPSGALGMEYLFR